MQNNVWFVTGAGRGLGRAVTEAALAAGHRVVATARRTESLAELERAQPTRLKVLMLDVTDRTAVIAAVAAAVEAFGRLDVVVNNAGYADLAAVEEIDPAAFRAQLDTNLFGVVNVCQAALPIMRAAGAGHIVNVSSVGARTATPGLGAYQAAKWAVSGLSEVLATEVAPLGIHVTAIEPGGMTTDWAGSSMTIPPIGTAYEPTVGMLAGALRSGAFTPAGDPAKVAAAVLELVGLPQPPVRLLLGSDALHAARAADRRQVASDAQWERLSVSTDRDDATDADRDPLGEAASDPATVVGRFLAEVVNGGRLELIDQLWTPDLRWHGGSMGEIEGLEDYRTMMATNAQGAFADMHLAIEDLITSGDLVVVRFTNSGTQIGPFMGTPPSGKHASWLGIGIYRVTDGRIAEAWFGEDVLGMLLQLDAITLPV